MIGIDVQQHGDVRIEFQERIYKFAGFTGHDVAGAASAAAVNAGQLAADECGQIYAGGEQDLRHHRGGRRLAVGAGNADGIVIPAGHNTQQFAPFQHRHAAGFGCDQFRIVCHDRRGVYDQVSPLNIFRTLSQIYGNAHVADCL